MFVVVLLSWKCDSKVVNQTIVSGAGNSLDEEAVGSLGNEFLPLPRAREAPLAGRFLNLHYCRKSARCHKMNHTTCMGVRLPYSSSTFELTDLSSEEHVQEMLQLYRYLRYIPKCWAVIQPFLCALYMPKCENGQVDLPSKEMCKITMRPCKVLYESGVFPDFMKCDDEQLFPEGKSCKNDIHELKFNMTGYCMEPLVKTDEPYWFYPGETGKIAVWYSSSGGEFICGACGFEGCATCKRRCVCLFE